MSSLPAEDRQVAGKATPEILIIGPDPSMKAAGIVTHIRNLLQYEPLKNARVIDVGSLNSPFRENRSTLIKMIMSLIRLRRLTRKWNGTIFINASIYRSSLYKLFLILFFIRKHHLLTLYIFFHGGRISKEMNSLLALHRFFPGIMRKADRLYFLSEEQKAGFEREFRLTNSFLYNNYSVSDTTIDRQSRGRDDIYRFLFVGRLDPEKGIFELIRAVKILKETSSLKFKLTIAGDGDSLTVLLEYVKVNQLDRNVEFSGFVSGEILDGLYAEADCLIMPSYHEGFPYVYIESMRAGLPVIATRTGALGRLIREGYNGCHVEMRDVDDLALKMKYFMEERPILTDNCYREFKNSLSKKKAEDFYRNILAK
jgi:glycosyltransferase involved in cell wall biosynthesis